jgi:FKBP-type peptidyl-prolyl cis-trans isomerase (trigger factor)
MVHNPPSQRFGGLLEQLRRCTAQHEKSAGPRRAVRQDLDAAAEREADAGVRGQLVEQLAAANNVSVPPSLRDRALVAYAKAYGIPDDQFQRFANEMATVIEAGVRRDLILDAAAEQAKLACTEKELDARVAEIAQRRGDAPGTVYAALEKAGRLRELERSITEEKVFAHLLALSEIEDAHAAR